MTQKQYADMVSIMQISRHFCEQMYKCLKNHGLMDKGFSLELKIGDYELSSGDIERSFICLEQDIMKDEYAWEKNRMVQRKTNALERWMVDYDPLAEEGSIPPVVADIKTTKDDVNERTGEDSSKPYPLDGTWLSSRDDYSDVDGGQ